MRTGPDSWQEVTKQQMTELCAAQPPNSVVPMVLRMSNSHPATETKAPTVESDAGAPN